MLLHGHCYCCYVDTHYTLTPGKLSLEGSYSLFTFVWSANTTRRSRSQVVFCYKLKEISPKVDIQIKLEYFGFCLSWQLHALDGRWTLLDLESLLTVVTLETFIQNTDQNDSHGGPLLVI